MTVDCGGNNFALGPLDTVWRESIVTPKDPGFYAGSTGNEIGTSGTVPGYN